MRFHEIFVRLQKNLQTEKKIGEEYEFRKDLASHMVGLLLAIALAGFSCVQTNLVKRNLPGILLGIYRCTILFF